MWLHLLWLPSGYGPRLPAAPLVDPDALAPDWWMGAHPTIDYHPPAASSDHPDHHQTAARSRSKPAPPSLVFLCTICEKKAHVCMRVWGITSRNNIWNESTTTSFDQLDLHHQISWHGCDQKHTTIVNIKRHMWKLVMVFLGMILDMCMCIFWSSGWS